jgi:hypothetical protein
VIGEKRLPARFYRTIGGAEPVRDWLKGLNPSDRRIVGADIKESEFDWPSACRFAGPWATAFGKFEAISHKVASRG